MLTLSNDQAQLVVDPGQGGRMASLRILGHEVLINSDPDPLKWGCYPMAPWAGRTRFGRFAVGEQFYSLPLTLPPHAIHGTVWQRQWTQTGPDTLETQLGSDWPFPGVARQQFILEEQSLTLHLSVHTLDAPFPATIGWHPWFRRKLGPSRARLSFHAAEMLEVDIDGIPNGKLCRPTRGPWDDCFRGVTASPSITWEHCLRLEISSDLDHWVVYDKPENGLCVEPMSGPPNALNRSPEWVLPERPLAGYMTVHWEDLAP